MASVLTVTIPGSPTTNPTSVTATIIQTWVAVITDPPPVDTPLPWVDFDATAVPTGMFEGR